ncbi:UDP-glucose 4-epimerase GalE [Aquitalea sp.]|jgi:UDP-glucose 4-epimerase|uniref:UDP-glucose 4-epimerase GalE n=1 Tax=Aquitalea sp. TaxID=1872623 RepID=UPI002585D1D9|nr:UDP-glucose 4-epimerase GalE [Aquitalea sp.]
MILVTGGAGYIGSHTCVELLNSGHEIIVLDNLCNSHETALRRIETLTGKKLHFIHGDVRDPATLAQAFSFPIKAVMHFAGLKAVGESVADPLRYYDNNVYGTLSLLQAMQQHGCRQFIFSSTATVYGIPDSVPVQEHFPLNPMQPYGRSKLMVEDMLRDLEQSDPDWRIAILRYFNPVGAHESGLIGEDPNGIPNNLMPFISQVAIGKLPKLNVFGNDYPTPDGTGIRDYIHVVDLAKGHVKALEALNNGSLTVNLGTGKGYSVLDMVNAFINSTGQDVPYQVSPRRAGDIAEYWASPEQATQRLGWRANRSLEDMCRDTWRWQQQNPNGYR